MGTRRWGLFLVLGGIATLAWVPALGLSATAGPPTTTEPVTIGFTCTFDNFTIDDWATIQVTKPAYVEPGDTFNVTFAVTDGPSSGALKPSPLVIYTGRTILA